MMRRKLRRNSKKFHDLPLVHDNETIAYTVCQNNIVRNDEKRAARPLRHTCETSTNGLACVFIEALRRLICQNPCGTASRCHGAEDALQHAARKFMRIRPEHALRLRQFKGTKKFCRFLLGKRLHARSTAHISQMSVDCPQGRQRLLRQLRHQPPDTAPQRCFLALCQCEYVFSIEPHLAAKFCTFRQQSEECLAEYGFAAAALADDAHHTSLCQMNAHIMQHRNPFSAHAKGHGEFLHLEALSLFFHLLTSSQRTSKRLRNSLAKILMDATKSRIHTPGIKTRCGALR